MLSYWERQSLLHFDHVLVGSGIVGLSTALELKLRFPSSEILVLERGLLPHGASTRNAGFACMGSVTELLDDLKTMSEEEVYLLFEKRKKGLDRLRKRLGDAKIGYQQNGSHELLPEQDLAALEKVDYLNQLLLPITGKPAFQLVNEKISQFGFSKTYTRALIESTCEGEIDTGKMMHALQQYALEKGITIITGAQVRRFEETDKEVRIEVENPHQDSLLEFVGKTCIFCTNAFTRQFFPEEDVVPGRGQVLVTYPIPQLRLKGIFHMEQGYYYFREIDGRILFGGGRNRDLEQETTTTFALNPVIQDDLEQWLRNVILPETPFQIDQRWAGIMAFGSRKSPIVRNFSDRIFGAFRLGGMGVALGSEVAASLADLVRSRH